MEKQLDTDFKRIAPDVRLGRDVKIYAFVNLYGCEIGDESSVGTFVEIQSGVKIGSRVKIQSHSFICTGVSIGDGSFIGHGVMFTNDKYPRSLNSTGALARNGDWECLYTKIGKRVSIGSNATILCGITVGDDALIGAGSVVTKDVPAGTVVAGCPARPLVDDRQMKKGN